MALDSESTHASSLTLLVAPDGMEPLVRENAVSDDALLPRLAASHAPLGLIEVGLIEVSGRAARNSPPTASAVETAATKN